MSNDEQSNAPRSLHEIWGAEKTALLVDCAAAYKLVKKDNSAGEHFLVLEIAEAALADFWHARDLENAEAGLK